MQEVEELLILRFFFKPGRILHSSGREDDDVMSGSGLLCNTVFEKYNVLKIHDKFRYFQKCFICPKSCEKIKENCISRQFILTLKTRILHCTPIKERRKNGGFGDHTIDHPPSSSFFLCPNSYPSLLLNELSHKLQVISPDEFSLFESAVRSTLQTLQLSCLVSLGQGLFRGN